MYAHQSLQDLIFLMFYGGTTVLALLAALYLWLRRSNAIAPDVNPPKVLRCCTATFFMAVVLSHVWWFALGFYWLTDDRLVRNITAVALDHVTLVPLAMAMLLRMLQDRHRRFWPWVLTQIPIVVLAFIGIAKHDEFYGLEMLHYWEVTVIVVFVAHYVYALIRYGRWLHDNYADLEHKEVWQSLLFVVIILIIYEIYTTNPGEMVREYLAQANTIFIIVFLLWRVETLQQLEEVIDETITDCDDEPKSASVAVPSNIGALLHDFCETPKLYLLHDLTLTQLSEIVGTNRTYLSCYFAQQGITYNAYINRLRIEHFERIYNESSSLMRPITANQLAYESGFKSYSTFATAFKLFKGQTVTDWMKSRNLQK